MILGTKNHRFHLTDNHFRVGRDDMICALLDIKRKRIEALHRITIRVEWWEDEDIELSKEADIL